MFPAWKSRGLPGADHEGTCALLRRVFDAGGCDASACDAHAWRGDFNSYECGRRHESVVQAGDAGTDHGSDYVVCAIPIDWSKYGSTWYEVPGYESCVRRRAWKKLDSVAKAQGITLEEGIYLQATGPNYETPAEIRMYRTLGADLVGMSTACEAMAARHAGMKIVGVSCVTNMAAGMSTGELNHKEVQETANKIAEDFQTLIYKFITEIG